MNFEPNKFFIGLMDFFSILLPGALLTYVIKDKVYYYIQENELALSCDGIEMVFALDRPEHSIIFLFVSYLLGHFIFLIGAKFLDDFLYEKISKKRFSKQVESIAVNIKEHYLNPLQASETINAFQWAKTRLNLNHPTALMEVQRHEANSKFFRSLLVVFFFLIPYSLWFGKWGIALAISPLMLLASWRYIEQRMKSVQLAYWYVISSEADDPEGYREKTKNGETEFTHAGGIVFKVKGIKKKYLLVKTKKPPYVWVLPKGHIEPGETSKETAIREVREETGVWAKITKCLGHSKFNLNEEVINVKFFLMETLEEGKSPENRNIHWFCLDKAIENVEHDDNKRLLGLLKPDN